MAEEEGEAVVFRKKAKRAASARHKKSRADEADADDDDDLQDKILGAKLEQKMRKRVKGLAVTETSDKAAQPEARDRVIGTEFTEQSTTTELDKARELFVEEQIERMRRGEQPELPAPSPLVATTGDPKFVSGGFQMPVESVPSRWIGSAKTVPEIELPKAELQRQYEYTKRVMEEERAKELARAEEREDPARRVVYNYNSVAFARKK